MFRVLQSDSKDTFGAIVLSYNPDITKICLPNERYEARGEAIRMSLSILANSQSVIVLNGFSTVESKRAYVGHRYLNVISWFLHQGRVYPYYLLDEVPAVCYVFTLDTPRHYREGASITKSETLLRI
jgi:hypothetical protein